MCCVLALEAWIHIVFHPAVGVALLVAWDVCDSQTIVDSVTGVDTLGHALRTERLNVAAAIVAIADEHPL